MKLHINILVILIILMLPHIQMGYSKVPVWYVVTMAIKLWIR